MNVYNLTQDEVFNIDKGNSTKNIDFNIDSIMNLLFMI